MEKLKPYLLLIGSLLLCFWQITFFQNMMKWDIMDIALPWRFYVVESINNGYLPLWNPYNHLGFPQMGDPSTWYPVTWLMALFGRYTVFNIQLEYLFHIILGAVGAYKLLFYLLVGQTKQKKSVRYLVLGFSFCFASSGFMIGNAQHLGWIISAAWVPWCIYLLLRLLKSPSFKHSIALALSMFMILSGGYPGFFITLSYLLLAIASWVILKRDGRHLWKKRVAHLLFSGTLFLLLSSVVLYCSFLMQTHIGRGIALLPDDSSGGVLFGSFPIEGLLSLITPLATTSNGFEWSQDISMRNMYFGVIPFLLSVLGVFTKGKERLQVLLFMAGLVFLVISLGEPFLLRKVLYFSLPFMDLFRFPALFRLFSILFFVLSAGLCLYKALEDEEYKRRLLRGVQIVLIMLLSMTVIILLMFFETPLQTGVENIPFYSSLTFEGRIVFQLFLSLVSAGAFYWCLKNAKYKLIVALMIIEGLAFSQMNMYDTVIDRENDPNLTENALSSALKGFPAPIKTTVIAENTDEKIKRYPYLWKNLGVFEKVLTADGVSPYGLHTFHAAAVSGELERVSRGYGLSFLDSHGLESSSTKITSFSPNEISIEVYADSEGILTFAQNNYTNWRVSIDNGDLKPIEGNFLNVAVPKGYHQVSFVFESPNEYAAFLVSALTFLYAVGFLIFLEFKKRLAKN